MCTAHGTTPGGCRQAGPNHFSPEMDNHCHECPEHSSTEINVASEVSECLGNAGWYDCASKDGCKLVEQGYYSPHLSNERKECPKHSTTAGKGAKSIDECMGNGGYFNCEEGECDTVGDCYYSPALSNSRLPCPQFSCTTHKTASNVTECLGMCGYGDCDSGTCKPAGKN